MEKIVQNVKAECIRRINESASKINACHDKLTPDQFWFKPNEASNAIGNLIMHLCGNLTQYIITTFNNQPDLRARSNEFYTKPKVSNEALLTGFNTVIDRVTSIINELGKDELEKSYDVQCYKETGTGILLHVTEHLSYHTGQIVYMTKMITDEKMNFYDDSALEKKGSVSNIYSSKLP